MKFCNLASGSKGNCTIVSSDNITLMIDDGLNIRDLAQRARESNIDLNSIDAILVTHEHSDHIKGISQLVKKYSIPLYCHKDSADGLDAYSAAYLVERDMDLPFEIGDIQISPFRLPHDSNYNLGYRLSDGKYTISIATDLGCMNEGIIHNLAESDLIMLESNHDID
ncbi:MAG: MBL fold metallo-hydrolase, partial [Clostridia bacterium]|nr:MBL fold metallo-hydrolase [Clostridia bacterium]